jgi:hypothetical protein
MRQNSKQYTPVAHTLAVLGTTDSDEHNVMSSLTIVLSPSLQPRRVQLGVPQREAQLHSLALRSLHRCLPLRLLPCPEDGHVHSIGRHRHRPQQPRTGVCQQQLDPSSPPLAATAFTCSRAPTGHTNGIVSAQALSVPASADDEATGRRLVQPNARRP